MFKTTIQKTVSVVVMVTMLSPHFAWAAELLTAQERKAQIFNQAKDFGKNAAQTTSSGIAGGFTAPSGQSYSASDIPGYNPNAAQESGLPSTFSSGMDGVESITNLQAGGIAAQPDSCSPVPEGDPGFQDYQYCLAKLYLKNKYQTATTNPYKSQAVDMKARSDQSNNPFISALGLNMPLGEGMCVDSTVTIPGGVVEDTCKDVKFTSLVGHTRSYAIENWDYRQPFCNTQTPGLPLDLLLSADKSVCERHYCTDLTHSLNMTTKVCSYFYNQPGGVFLCSGTYAASYHSEVAKCDPGFELADDPSNTSQKICRKFSHYSCPEGQFLDGAMCQDTTGFVLQEQSHCQVIEDNPDENRRLYYCDAPSIDGCADIPNNCTVTGETCTYYDEVATSPTFGQCLSSFKTYSCPLEPVVATITQCGGSDQICIDGNCFNDMQKMCGPGNPSELEANSKVVEYQACQEYLKETYPTCAVQPIYGYNAETKKYDLIIGYEPVPDCPWLDQTQVLATYPNGCTMQRLHQDEDGNWPTQATFACWGERTDFFCREHAEDTECTHTQTLCDRYSPFNSSICLDLESRYTCERPKIVPTDECTADFASALMGMETGRQAGTYMDPETNKIFGGEYSRCDFRRAAVAGASFGHKDCCKASAPAPKSNAYNMGEDLVGQLQWQALQYGIGSASNFVYDSVMTAGRYFAQGMQSWQQAAQATEAANTAANGTSLASSFGVSAAGFTATLGATTGMATIGTGAAVASGTATTTFSTAMTSGALQTYSVGSVGPINLTFNPAMFYVAVAIALYSAYQDAIACDNEDYQTTTKRKGKLCYAYNSYCESKSCDPFGGCTCTKHRTQHCCFNSKIARMINQQGKPQLGLPLSDCSGFTPEQFTQLDFSQIDLSEFVSDILKQAKKTAFSLSDVDALQQKIKDKISTSGVDGVQVEKPLNTQ